MSRSGYTDECDGWEFVRWRGAVNSAIRGKRGQAFLNEMVTALDAMQEKRLLVRLAGDRGRRLLRARGGRPCAQHGPDADRPDDRETVARTFGIAEARRDHVRQRRRRGRFCLGES